MKEPSRRKYRKKYSVKSTRKRLARQGKKPRMTLYDLIFERPKKVKGYEDRNLD